MTDDGWKEQHVRSLLLRSRKGKVSSQTEGIGKKKKPAELSAKVVPCTNATKRVCY